MFFFLSFLFPFIYLIIFPIPFLHIQPFWFLVENYLCMTITVLTSQIPSSFSLFFSTDLAPPASWTVMARWLVIASRATKGGVARSAPAVMRATPMCLVIHAGQVSVKRWESWQFVLTFFFVSLSRFSFQVAWPLVE